METTDLHYLAMLKKFNDIHITSLLKGCLYFQCYLPMYAMVHFSSFHHSQFCFHHSQFCALVFNGYLQYLSFYHTKPLKHTPSLLRLKQSQLLCILTGKRGLCISFAGQNHLFLRYNKFFRIFPSLTEVVYQHLGVTL